MIVTETYCPAQCYCIGLPNVHSCMLIAQQIIKFVHTVLNKEFCFAKRPADKTERRHFRWQTEVHSITVVIIAVV